MDNVDLFNIETNLVRHMVLMGWFVTEVVKEDGMIMVRGHDGSEDKLECGLCWLEHGPSEFWILRPGRGGDYSPYFVNLKVI